MQKSIVDRNEQAKLRKEIRDKHNKERIINLKRTAENMIGMPTELKEQDIIKMRSGFLNDKELKYMKFDLDNKIIGESIKSLIQKWNFAFDELNIDNAFTFANSDFYSPSIKDKINEEEKKKQQSEKLSNDMAIIYKLNKESFQIYIDKMDEKKIIPYENILILTDILKEIKYYTKEIINQTSNNLIKLYRDNILEILTSLESALRFEFLFICIIPLSELIWKEMNKRVNMIRNKSLMKELIDYRYQRNSLNNEKKNINRNISGSWSSDLDNPNDNDSDKDMDEDYVLEFESEEPQINDQNKGGGENKKNSFFDIRFYRPKQTKKIYL